DDNSRNPKKKVEAKDSVVKLLSVIRDTMEKYKAKEIVNTLIGRENAVIVSYRTNEKPFFGIGRDKDDKYWMALVRQVMVAKLIRKEIEQYGVLHVTETGKSFLEKPTSFMMTDDHVYSKTDDVTVDTGSNSFGSVTD